MAENKDPNNLNNQQNSVGNSANNSFGDNNTPRLEDLLNQSSSAPKLEDLLNQSSQPSKKSKKDAKKEKELKKQEEQERKRKQEREKLESNLFGGAGSGSGQPPQSQTPNQDARNQNASDPTGQRPSIPNPFGFSPIGQSAPRQNVPPVAPTPQPSSTLAPTPQTPNTPTSTSPVSQPSQSEKAESDVKTAINQQGESFGLPKPTDEQKVQPNEPEEDGGDEKEDENKNQKQKQDKKYSFYTKKELNLLVKQAVKSNRDFTKNDVLDIEERKLREQLQDLERREQEYVEKVKEISKAHGISSVVKKQKPTPIVGGGPIRSIDDLFSAARPVGAPEPEQQKTLQDYINELKERNFEDVDPDALEQESEELALEKDEIVARLEMIEDSRVEEEEGRRRRAGFIWFMLMGAFVVIVSLLGYYIYITFRPPDPQLVEVRVEMVDIESVFYNVVTDGTETRLEPILIKPLDVFNLKIVARNVGDNNDLDFYLRFKIYIATKEESGNGVEDVEHNDTIIYGREDFDADWHRYNELEEAEYIRQVTGQPYVTEDDGYSYYKGILERDEEIVLIDKLQFSDNTDMFAGKQVEIVVLVEAVSYFDADIGTPTWDTAPREWVTFIGAMQQDLEG